ncbi:PAS domain-containing protein [Mucilaginibacter daejeonensis]|uniref:PAS domain-containing protein n=1 Tax=Mucilaginibacter daejeonensis TaxID=398049 RepID=UPI001D17519A|nr:PAS domain-containing protein [Mucilaginibacter daejeonensis]UEG55179.1 PAS domain-containing protein [Mucilaginibacter daejeonensis]
MRKFNLLLIIVYLIAGTIWLVSGSWLINRLKALDPTADLQYLFDIKNLVFLLVSIISIVLIVNARYSRLLLKEQVLNKQLSEQERSLRSSVIDFELVNKATNDVIWDYDILKDELKWLHGYKELFGYQDLLVVKAAFWNMQKIHPEDQKDVIAMFDALLNGDQQRWSVEYRYRCSDGTYKYVSDRGYLIRNAAHEPIRMLGAIQDIDRQKTYSQLLERQNEQLKQVAWLNSHEIRRPLCNITGLIPLMESSVDDPETMASLIAMIKRSSDELDNSIAKINETAEAGFTVT